CFIRPKYLATVPPSYPPSHCSGLHCWGLHCWASTAGPPLLASTAGPPLLGLHYWPPLLASTAGPPLLSSCCPLILVLHCCPLILPPAAALIIFAIAADYEDSASARHYGNATAAARRTESWQSPHDPINHYYPSESGGSAMILGFVDESRVTSMRDSIIMIVSRRPRDDISLASGFDDLPEAVRYSSVSLNLLIASLALQWAAVVKGFPVYEQRQSLRLALINSDFATASVLISFGALLGKLSPMQSLVLAMVEIPIFAANEHIGAVDIGGSMYVHVFGGAYFGLAAARVLCTKSTNEHPAGGRNYQSDLFSMIGTRVPVDVLPPSFNSALAPGDDRQRAVLLPSPWSSMLSGENKAGHGARAQNATLAGGVAVGTTADFMIGPWCAILIGPKMNAAKIHDTCGVNNLHGMPGLMAGLFGVLFTLDWPTLRTTAPGGRLQLLLYAIFTAMAPKTEEGAPLPGGDARDGVVEVEDGLGRSSWNQAGFQAAGVGASPSSSRCSAACWQAYCFACTFWNNLTSDDLFSDERFWEVPSELFHPSRSVADLDNFATASGDCGAPTAACRWLRQSASQGPPRGQPLDFGNLTPADLKQPAAIQN
uniref:Ammonium_transp domain-containing protein n=1 Tax=Macrostomum lignano TaxID=282301 RepID=A0A1I8FI43_9PLAT